MSAFWSELEPRRLLRLDEPGQHLTPRQFTIAMLITAVAAAFWAYVARHWIVAVVMMAQVVTIWRSRAAEERPLMRLGAALIYGAIVTAWILVIKRFGLVR